MAIVRKLVSAGVPEHVRVDAGRPLQQPRTCVILEEFGIADIVARLRASEVCDLQWHQIELSEGRLHVRRVKNGTPSVHPIRGDEMRALRKLRREHPSDAYVFVSERGGPMRA